MNILERSQVLDRRSLLLGAGAIGAVGVLSACGAEPKSGTDGATISHRFGSSTFPARPKRVVSLGGGDMEATIALGVTPVGGADWFGLDTGVRPWVADHLGSGKRPKLLNGSEPDYEKISALRPDTILYVNTTNDQKVYKTLAKIAPTLAGPASVKNSYGVPWREQVALIGKALGREARAEQVVARTEKTVDAARADHPRFAGRTITAGVLNNDVVSVWMPSDPRMRLLEDLGFTTNPAVDKLDTGDFYAEVSFERLDLLEADVLLLAAMRPDGKPDPDLVGNPAFSRLDVVRQGRTAYFPGAGSIMSTDAMGNFSSSFSIGGPLGIPACLPELDKLLSGVVRA